MRSNTSILTTTIAVLATQSYASSIFPGLEEAKGRLRQQLSNGDVVEKSENVPNTGAHQHEDDKQPKRRQMRQGGHRPQPRSGNYGGSPVVGTHRSHPQSNPGEYQIQSSQHAGYSYESKRAKKSRGHSQDSYYYSSTAEPAYDDYYFHYDDDYSYGYNYGDSSAQEVIFLSAWQDNRFSSPDPIYVTPNAPDPEATGNVWLYADVPLQEETGIDADALLGFAQGTCESIFSNQNGYCHFTYEFFDGLEVIASITAEGETQPTGPSILTVLGGTGELKGATGEVTLTPASLDETVTPPAIVDDGSSFLGNPVGYYMEAVLYVSYNLADMVDDDVVWETMYPEDPGTTEPVETNAPGETETSDPMETPAPDSEMDTPAETASVGDGRVVCPGMDAQFDYCDCDIDCGDSPDHRCGCPEAWENSCCGAGKK